MRVQCVKCFSENTGRITEPVPSFDYNNKFASGFLAKNNVITYVCYDCDHEFKKKAVAPSVRKALKSEIDFTYWNWEIKNKNGTYFVTRNGKKGLNLLIWSEDGLHYKATAWGKYVDYFIDDDVPDVLIGIWRPDARNEIKINFDDQ